MTVSITRTGAPGSVLYPEIIELPEWTRDFGNGTHDIAGGTVPAVTYEPAGLRRGRLRIVCASLTDALAMESLHVTASSTFALADTVASGLNMTYVPVGDIKVTVDPRTLKKYIVEVGFQQLS